MTILRLILLYAHLLGFAVLLGAAVAQYVAKPVKINAPMFWGAGAQLVTGIALAAPLGRDEELNPAKLGVKLVVALMIFVMVFFSRRRETVNTGHFLAIVGLTLANAAVAVFWR